MIQNSIEYRMSYNTGMSVKYNIDVKINFKAQNKDPINVPGA